MVSNDPSDARPADPGDGDRDGTADEDAASDEPAAVGSGDEVADSIPEDVPGRPAGTLDESSAGEADATSGAASTTEAAGDGESPTDEVPGETAAGPGSDLAPDEQYCYSCGAVIKREAVICPECGVSQEQSTSSDKDPGVAALLSAVGFIFPIAAGAGQIYNGEIGKGVAFSLIQVFNVFLVFLLIGFITYPLVGIWAIYDAYQNAQ